MILVYIYISKWLKDEFETPNGNKHEMDQWQFIYIKYKGHNII